MYPRLQKEGNTMSLRDKIANHPHLNEKELTKLVNEAARKHDADAETARQLGVIAQGYGRRAKTRTFGKKSEMLALPSGN